MKTSNETSKGTDFGSALATLKSGKKVARLGWNGKGMYLFLGKPQSTGIGVADPHFSVAELGMPMLETICMKTADNQILTGWLASQTDLLAEDWVEVRS